MKIRMLYPIKIDREGYSIATIHRNLAKNLSDSIDITAFKENKFTEIKNVKLIHSFHNRYLDALWINFVSLFILFRIDVIHMVPNIALLPMFLYAKLLGKKVVNTLHETIDETLKRSWHERFVLILFAKYSAQLTCVSEFVKQSAVDKLNLSPIVIHSGIEEGVFVHKPDISRIRKEFEIHNQNPIALYVGALREGKGADVFVELAELFKKINFIMIGKGALYDSLKNTISESKNIFYKPHYEYNKLFRLYSSSDMLIFPSIIDSFGLVCLEAISCGIPVVAFENSGAKEILTPKTGILCKNINEMKTAINRILDKKFIFSSKEAALIRKLFNWNNLSKRYLEVYQFYEKD